VYLYCLSCSAVSLYLHSFPTRRSSDLLRGLETGLTGFNEIEIDGLADVEDDASARAAVMRALGQPTPDRIRVIAQAFRHGLSVEDRKSTRLNSSHVKISYAVFCLKKKK